MDLDDHHQPSYDPEDDEDETLSLRDLPLSTNSDVTWDGSNLHHQQQDVFEFFNGDVNPSFTSSFHDDSIIFCGKIIPYRGAKPGEDDHKKKGMTKSNNSSWKSSSLTEPRSDLYPDHGQVSRFWSLPLSTSSELETKRVSSRKSRWYLLAFGVGKVPVKMELDDLKFRQSRKMSSSYSSSSQKFQPSRKSSRGLLAILGCGREDANSMVKGSLVCIPSV